MRGKDAVMCQSYFEHLLRLATIKAPTEMSGFKIGTFSRSSGRVMPKSRTILVYFRPRTC